MREFSSDAVLSMSDSTMVVSSKYTQDLSVQIVFFTLSCKWFLCFYFGAVIWSSIVDLFAALHELASASARTLLKLASSVRTLLKPYEDTLRWPNIVFKSLCLILQLLNYLCFGAHFLPESRLITEVFILAFLQGCMLLPWQRGWLKTGLR